MFDLTHESFSASRLSGNGSPRGPGESASPSDAGISPFVADPFAEG